MSIYSDRQWERAIDEEDARVDHWILVHEGKKRNRAERIESRREGNRKHEPSPLPQLESACYYKGCPFPAVGFGYDAHGIVSACRNHLSFLTMERGQCGDKSILASFVQHTGSGSRLWIPSKETGRTVDDDLSMHNPQWRLRVPRHRYDSKANIERFLDRERRARTKVEREVQLELRQQKAAAVWSRRDVARDNGQKMRLQDEEALLFRDLFVASGHTSRYGLPKDFWDIYNVQRYALRQRRQKEHAQRQRDIWVQKRALGLVVNGRMLSAV